MTSDLYADLGVAKDADAGAIKRAYRARAQKAHPDKVGGDADKFHAIQVAYDVLSDGKRRAEYDRTGRIPNESDKHAELLQLLAKLVLEAVEHSDPDHDDILAMVRDGITEGQGELHKKIPKIKKEIAKRESALKRLTKKGAGNNFIAQVLERDAAQMRAQIEHVKERLATADEMLKLLKDYSYKVEEAFTRSSLDAALDRSGIFHQARRP